MRVIRGPVLAAILAIPLMAAAAGTATAGPPPPSCTCLASDRLVFGIADPFYAITATILSCNECNDMGGGKNFIGADVRVTFGPYDPGISMCAPGTNSLVFPVRLNVLNQPVPPSGELFVIPAPEDDATAIDVPASPALKTACITSLALDYSIERVRFSGAVGAEAMPALPGGPSLSLNLPDAVRSTAGDLLQVTTGLVRLSQSLNFSVEIILLAGSPFRFWAEGLPFRLLPAGGFYHRDEIVLGEGSDYFPTPPDPANLAGAVTPRLCNSPPTGFPTCTGGQVPSNVGYLDLPAWVPTAARIDTGGLDVTLDLPPSTPAVYEPIFPRGTWVALEGPATVLVEDSTIVGGGFAGGMVAVEFRPPNCPATPFSQTQYVLNLAPSPQGPTLGLHGRLFAAIASLNEDGVIGFTHHRLFNLGCGTFYMPPPLADLGPVGQRHGPQHEWLGPEGYDLAGRGLYAGLNYDRLKVCVQGGTFGTQFCREDLDCQGGGTCSAIWSPLCTAPAPEAAWFSKFNGNGILKLIDPNGTTPMEKTEELAFYVRRSGVTGVFDGGIEPFSMGDPAQNSFKISFNSFGVAALASRTEQGIADTALRGVIEVPWPTDANLPFDEMAVCDCGGLDSAAPPDDIQLASKLNYWDQPFSPYSYQFSVVPPPPAPPEPCPMSPGAACSVSGSTSAAYVCIDAHTSVPHFDPEFVASFDLKPQGQPGVLNPSKPDFDLDQAASIGLGPYDVAVEGFNFSDWAAAGTPGKSVVLGGTQPFGDLDAYGQLELPYFDTPKAGIMVRLKAPHASPIDPGKHLLDLHKYLDKSQSYVQVGNKIAGDHIDVDYAVDYFQPESLAGNAYGDDSQGRGLMLGYSRSAATDLEAISVRTGVVMDPQTIRGDVGPAAAMRAWGLTNTAGHAQLSGGGSILPPSPVHPSLQQALDKLDQAVGDLPATLRTTADLTDALHQLGAAEALKMHSDASAVFKIENPPGNPIGSGIQADTITGFLDFSGGGDTLDKVLVDSSLKTGGKFFAFKRSQVSVERFVEQGVSQAMISFSRKDIADAMELPGKQNIAFPGGSAMSWKFDYAPGPSFHFNSLTGSLDLTHGGFSGVAFDELSATLKYDKDGNWYFESHLDVEFNGYGVSGALLLGNTKDMGPLKALDKDVASFLKGLDKFQGAYVSCGVKTKLIDYGCVLNVKTGAEVGGWYLDDSYGGQVSGWVSGKGVCLVTVKGKAKLIGGEAGDLFKLEGSFWAAGGIGLCDEDDWDSPGDAFDDDWCYACVVKTKVTGHYPPEDLDLSWSKPNTDCD